MRNVLFDTGTPRHLQTHLVGHAVDLAQQRGWAKLANSKLLDEAEEAGYDVLITTDRSRSYPKGTRLTTEGSSGWTRRCRIM